MTMIMTLGLSIICCGPLIVGFYELYEVNVIKLVLC